MLFIPSSSHLGLPDSSVGKESTCNAGGPQSNSWLGRSPGEGIDYPLQNSGAFLVSQLVKNLLAMQETLDRPPAAVFQTGEFHGLQRNQRSNCQHPLDHGKSKSSRKNIYFCFIDYAKAFHCVDHNELWKILKEMGIPDHLTCLLRNLYTGQEATVRTGHGTDWFQIGKGVHQGCILSPCLFNLYAEFSSVQFSSVSQSCLTLCDPMNHSTPGLPVHHHLPESL